MKKTRPVVSVSVRELVEFVMLAGDLERGVSFGEPAMLAAWEGTKGHQEIQESWPENYQAEVPLSWKVEASDHILKIRGRVDGIQALDNTVMIEEIKTYSGFRELTPSPVHWAQGKVYAYIYMQEHPDVSMAVQLTYMHRKTREITTFRESFSGEELTTFFEKLVAEYAEWVSLRLRWIAQRDQSIRDLNFPYPEYRAGQRYLAVAAYRAIADQQTLFAEAPTGIGKTMAVLFPAAKAMAEGLVEKLFYLTAKTVGRTVAEKALDDLRAAGLSLRAVTLTAREKMCARNGEPCDVPNCPFAIGYYDRLKPALRDGMELQALTMQEVQKLAEKHQMCPFELSLDLSQWSDAIICDYNYVFDPKVYLRRYFDQKKSAYTFLIDEAHNLVDRARSMFSAELTKQSILEVKREIQTLYPTLAKHLHRINRYLVQLRKQLEQTENLPYKHTLILPDCPKEWIGLLEDFLEEAALELSKESAVLPEALMDLYFQINSFVRASELFDTENFVAYFYERYKHTKICLYCLDPSKLVQKAFQRGKSAVLFSATLRPMDYYRDLLGHVEDAPTLQLPSPFPPENLHVYVNQRIETTYRRREHTYDEVVAAAASLVRQHVGNYMIYFPSYKYMGEVWSRFVEAHPEIKTLPQMPGMSEHDRLAFLDAFQVQPESTLVGFAVMGGVFGEGIDLVGDRLRGVVIVGVGLPQVCLERDLIRTHFQHKNNAGFAYAYIYPGMNKVLQAVGRLIRTEVDEGEALLIDKRFSYQSYRSLFPPWWNPRFLRER